MTYCVHGVYLGEECLSCKMALGMEVDKDKLIEQLQDSIIRLLNDLDDYYGRRDDQNLE